MSSRSPRSPAPATASRTIGTGFRARPLAKLRTINEAAELEHIAAHSAPLYRVGCTPRASVRAPRSNCRCRSRGAPRRESQRLTRGPFGHLEA
jgi:hypothetical protein